VSTNFLFEKFLPTEKSCFVYSRLLICVYNEKIGDFRNKSPYFLDKCCKGILNSSFQLSDSKCSISFATHFLFHTEFVLNTLIFILGALCEIEKVTTSGDHLRSFVHLSVCL
jgi:hypothetical protein